jgi:diguanylate cyclase (GGDEF)-like protein/PAS domain S-box-containing protein
MGSDAFRGDRRPADGTEGESGSATGTGADAACPVSLAALIETVPGLVFQRVLHPDGRLDYPYLSDSLKTYVGHDPRNPRMARDGSLDFIHWADRDGYLERVRDSARTGERCEESFRAIGLDGEVHWFAGTSLPRRRTDGAVVWDGTLIDITDRKRAEYWLGMIMDHAADVIITMDDRGHIESSNAASRAVFGHDPEHLAGRPASMLMPQLEQGDLSEVLRRYVTSGEDTLVGAGPRDLEGRHHNGALFPIEVALSEVLTEGRRLFIAVIRDISQRKSAEAALRESQRRLTNIAENVQGLVFQRTLTAEGALRFSYVSGSTLADLHLGAEAVMRDGNLFLQALHPDDRVRFLATLRRSARTLEPMEDDYRLRGPDGEERWLRGLSQPRRTPDGAVMWEGVALDVTERKQAENRLTFLAYHDPLTGLGNRTSFLETLTSTMDADREAALGNGGATAQPPRRIALLAMGFDRFSIVNATMGHTIGDRVLVAAAQRLRDTIGSTDLVCRTGGDRFMAMLTDCPDDTTLTDSVSRLQTVFLRPIQIDGHQFDLSISLGVSLFPDHGHDAETLIMHADAALHEAKLEGGNACRIFTPEIGAQAAHILSLRHRMRKALEARAFKAYFQPQVDLETNRIVGTEALARWIQPDGTQISPGEFIPVAEEYGLIDEICIQILEDASQWTARWNRAGHGPLSVAVNISARQFHNPVHLMEIVNEALAVEGMAPDMLELELTESTAMSDPDNASRIMRLFTDRGIGCSIDDFGTGYSSLAVLKRFALRKLKIDRAFVRDVTTDPNDAAICSALIAMAHALHLRVCAEGVETPDQLAFLRAQNCDQVQGFLFARPLPPEAMEALLIKGVEAPDIA